MDTHETSFLIFSKTIARLLKVKILPNFEYIIYREKLSYHENYRLKINTKNLEKMLIHIEDKQFYSHKGVSIKGLARLILSAIGRHRRSGGSTITQQLVRTLFIIDHKKLVRRKILELMLACWFDKVIVKQIQLSIYLSSVRFESQTYGVASAMRYFFGEIKQSPTKAESFFLIERVSNIRSLILAEKINQTIKSAYNANLLTDEDIAQVLEIYSNAIKAGKIENKTNKDLSDLVRAWKNKSTTT